MKRVKILSLTVFLIILWFNNVNFVFAYKCNVNFNDDGSKTFEYDLSGDIFDERLNVDESINPDKYILKNDSKIENYDSAVINKIDSLMKIEPSDTEAEINMKKLYNSQILNYKSSYSLLVEYLENLKDAISDEEKELILNNLPALMDDKIYFDNDYNDVSIDDMKKIYSALCKIYDVVKTTANPLIYYEHLGYDKYIYGYNIDFLRSNIKSLKNAISRKKILKVDKEKLESVKHNEDLDDSYHIDIYNGEKIRYPFKVIEVSNLIDSVYYKVLIECDEYVNIDISEISEDLKKGDKIVIKTGNSELYDYNILKEEYIEYGENKSYRVVDYKNKNGDEGQITDYIISVKPNSKYVICVYKNAIYEEYKEYFINNYVGYDNLEDNFYDNLETTDNLFSRKCKGNLIINELVFDDKGYVKNLFFVRGQYD